MKKFVFEFIRRGLIACGFGPLVLAVFYMIMQGNGRLQALTVNEVCVGIFSLSALAFIAGGMNVLYQVERIPLLVSVFIHGAVLYAGYLVTYLINGWLKSGVIPMLIFSGIFVVGYLVIWVMISSTVKRKTEKINALLKQKQQSAEDN